MEQFITSCKAFFYPMDAEKSTFEIYALRPYSNEIRQKIGTSNSLESAKLAIQFDTALHQGLCKYYVKEVTKN